MSTWINLGNHTEWKKIVLYMKYQLKIGRFLKQGFNYITSFIILRKKENPKEHSQMLPFIKHGLWVQRFLLYSPFS